MNTITYRAPRGNGRGYFLPRDREFFDNTKGMAKVREGVKRLPYKINFIIDDSGETNTQNKSKVESTPGVITIVYSNNITNPRGWMPMNLWTMCHRIGHIWQTNALQMKKDGCDIGYRNLSRLWNLTFPEMKIAAQDSAALSSVCYLPGDKQVGELNLAFRLFCCTVMTQKSARQFNIVNELDIVAELIAQYLVTGRIRLRAPTREAIRTMAQTYVVSPTRMDYGRRILVKPEEFESIADFPANMEEVVSQVEQDIEREIKETLDCMIGGTFSF